MPVDMLVVDDGSSDATAAIGARARRPGGLARGLARPRAPRSAPGSTLARDEGYAAAVYLDGDGEYDPADFERVLEPGRARARRLRARLALPRARARA